MTGGHHICSSDHELRQIVYVDPLDRGYCAECLTTLSIGSVTRAMGCLTIPALTEAGR